MFAEKQNIPRKVLQRRLCRAICIFNSQFTWLTSPHSFSTSVVPVQLYKANLLKRPILQYFTPETLQTTLHCADKTWIICLNFSLFWPVWNLVYRNKSHLRNAYKSSQVHISRTEKKDKNFKADNRISTNFTNIFQEQSWLQDQFKKRYVTYAQNTSQQKTHSRKDDSV